MHKELNFEDAIEDVLLTEGGYSKGNPDEYDRDRALFPKDIIAFVQQTQPKFWDRFAQMNQGKAQEILLDSLVKELQSKGMLTVLRSGFKCFGKTVRLAYFAPNTGMNPDALTRYNQNRLTLIRQVNTASGVIPDIILAVNGLPIISLELKNPMSGQTIENAKHQYRYDRDPKELLFTFKQRCLVFFGVDTEEVTMTTKLDGKDTFFLPFNRGHQYGKGNPPVAGDYRSAYLWREVLTKESLLDILARFLHLQIDEKTVATEKGLTEILHLIETPRSWHSTALN